MDLDETLSWPFFDDGHRRFAQALARWADATPPALPHDDVDAACRARVKALADAGFLKAVVPAEHGGLHPRLDVRTLQRLLQQWVVEEVDLADRQVVGCPPVGVHLAQFLGG